MAKQLVRLWKRPSYDGKSFTYYLLYTDEQGKRKQKSLGHTDARKAERQRAQFERELRMGIVELESMKLSEFLEDSLRRTKGQVRENTLSEYDSAMRHFIEVTGDIDYLRVKHEHGERFVQACLDCGNSPATARKKISALKRLFQMAIERGQLEENPFRHVCKPRVPKRRIRIYSDDECIRLMNAARKSQIGSPVRWDLLIVTALNTGLRRGELLNITWHDIDFEKQVVEVSPKRDTDQTWEWHIKDTERRRVPLTPEVVGLLAQHQAEQPTGYPYVFIPPFRYDRIQLLRRKGAWSVRKGNCPLNNFTRRFRAILFRAGIEQGEFHDLRRTCLSNWFANGLREYDVMKMAGHSSFETTRTFYLAIRDDLLERARAASTRALRQISVAKLLQVPSGAQSEYEAPEVSP
jgi:integrase